MQIQVNTDINIEGHEELAERVRAIVEETLQRLGQHITRVEVHLSDQDGAAREGRSEQPDKRCLMEARLEGRQPVAVSEQAGTVHQAVQGAADKLVRLIDSALGRSARDERAPRPAMGG